MSNYTLKSSSNSAKNGLQEPIVRLTTTTLLGHALDYASRNWAVFPCQESGSKAKAPYIAGGFKNASTDIQQLRKWWQQFPGALIGGAIPEGYLVIDIDPRNGGNLETLETLTGKLPQTLTAYSGRGDGGRHYYYMLPYPLDQSSAITANPVAGVDIKLGGKGYMIMPPSLHPATGKPYMWQIPDGRDLVSQLTVFPDTALEALTKTPEELNHNKTTARAYKPNEQHETGVYASIARAVFSSRVEAIVDVMAQARPGNRNRALYWCLNRLFDAQASSEDFETLRRTAANTGLSTQEITSTELSALKGRG